MACVNDVHHEDITCLNFSKKEHQRLIAGSDDGIVCTYDLTQPTIEEVRLSDQAADNLINVEEGLISVNFMDNDVKRAYAVRGGLDICDCNLETDTYKQVAQMLKTDEQTFLNTFENKDGSVFFSRAATSASEQIDVCSMNGSLIAQVEAQKKATTKGLFVFNQSIVGINRDSSQLSLYKADGIVPRKEQSVQSMMQEELFDDELPQHSAGRGNKLKPHFKK